MCILFPNVTFYEGTAVDDLGMCLIHYFLQMGSVTNVPNMSYLLQIILGNSALLLSRSEAISNRGPTDMFSVLLPLFLLDVENRFHFCNTVIL